MRFLAKTTTLFTASVLGFLPEDSGPLFCWCANFQPRNSCQGRKIFLVFLPKKEKIFLKNVHYLVNYAIFQIYPYQNVF